MRIDWSAGFLEGLSLSRLGPSWVVGAGSGSATFSAGRFFVEGFFFFGFSFSVVGVESGWDLRPIFKVILRWGSAGDAVAGGAGGAGAGAGAVGVDAESAGGCDGFLPNFSLSIGRGVSDMMRGNARSPCAITEERGGGEG